MKMNRGTLKGGYGEKSKCGVWYGPGGVLSPLPLSCKTSPLWEALLCLSPSPSLPLVNEETSSCHPGPHGKGQAATPDPCHVSCSPLVLLGLSGEENILLAEKGQVSKEGSTKAEDSHSDRGCHREERGCPTTAGPRENRGMRHQDREGL